MGDLDLSLFLNGWRVHWHYSVITANGASPAHLCAFLALRSLPVSVIILARLARLLGNHEQFVFF